MRKESSALDWQEEVRVTKQEAVDVERAGGEKHLLASLWGGRALPAFFREESGQWLPP